MIRIFEHLKTDWFRYGFETLAVIVGILSAFAIDSWDEERKEIKRENSTWKISGLNLLPIKAQQNVIWSFREYKDPIVNC